MRFTSLGMSRRMAIAVATGLGLNAAAHAADSTGYITWSISGSTAMRNFTVGVPGSSAGGLSLLETPLNLTLSNGTYSGGGNGLQLAPSTWSSANLAGSTGPGVRVEWHEAGSVEGVLELANDQIGYVGGASGVPIVDPFTPRNASSGNPIWVNRNKLTTSAGAASNSFGTIGTSSYNTYTNYSATGTNLQGGQNRVQMAISDVVPVQGFSKTSGNTPAAGTPVYALRPGDTGYGKGNNALSTSSNLAALGNAGARQQLVDDSALNMSTDKVNPQTGANYSTGAWNNGGVNNLVSQTVAVTATVFAANPGTGLTQVNKTDAQWLQTTGRLKNGVDFNMTERDTNSGTRNVAALNTGVDPSWAVGENDGGNGYATDGVAQSAIGGAMKFSGKTAGGGLLRPTVQNNRMAVGVLGMSDAIGSVKNNSSTTPLRALAYSNTTDSQSGNYVQPNTATITDGSYVIWQKEQYVTVRTPDANYGNTDSIKGDATGDIAKLRNNVIQSVQANFPNQASFNDPADQLIANSFLLPQFMLVDKATDGGATSDVSGQVVNGQTHTQWRNAAINPANGVTANFDTTAGANVTAGVGAQYGVTSTTTLASGAVNVPITAQDSSGNATSAAAAPKGNYLYGNFNQNGVRDFSAVKAAAAAQAALYTAGGAAAEDVNNTAFSNSTKIAGVAAALASMNAGTGASKGDLVVLGDYNGDGKFDGKDLYSMAHGAAVSDASGTGFTNGTLTATAATFGAALPNAVLRKNAALDYMQANTTAQQKLEASANTVSDPNGANAFNKFDVNRDGLVTRADAQLVDHFVGNDYRNLNQQLTAIVADNGTVLDGKDINGNSITESPRLISLVDVELNDTGDITNTADANGNSDFKLIRQALGSSLLDGDSDFNGSVNSTDLSLLLNHYNQAGQWSTGDYDFNGLVNSTDLSLLLNKYNQTASSPAFDVVALRLPADVYWMLKNDGINVVPEPTSLALIAGVGLLATRRRRGC